MQQAQRLIKHVHEVALRLQTHLGVGLAAQIGLGELDVPVAELAPEERVELASHLAELIRLDATRHLLGKARETAEDPRVGLRARNGLTRREAVEVAEHETARVPDLRHERTRLLGARAADELVRLLVDIGVEAHVLVVGDKRQQVEAHRVGAVHGDEVHRIDAVALGLGHARAVLGEDGSVDHHVLERNLLAEVGGRHDHARHPQRDDVARGHERRRGMVSLHALGMIGPALRGERPQLA